MKCELISKSVGLGSYEELNHEELIAAIARHGTIKDDNGKLIKYLIDNAHWSPLQHISFGFKVQTSRAISAQIFRHRSLNGQEWSQRYSSSDNIEEIELRKEHPTNRQSSTESFDPMLNLTWSVDDSYDVKASDAIEDAMGKVHSLYNELLEAGVAKECARMILPMGSTTHIHITATFRDLLGFLNVRCDHHAQKEVQDIAIAIGEELEKEMPRVMSRIDWRKGMFM